MQPRTLFLPTPMDAVTGEKSKNTAVSFENGGSHLHLIIAFSLFYSDSNVNTHAHGNIVSNWSH